MKLKPSKICICTHCGWVMISKGPLFTEGEKVRCFQCFEVFEAKPINTTNDK